MINKNAMPCNRPQRTPGHPTKSHVVKACAAGQEKIVRFGEQNAKTAGKPKAGESDAMKKKRKSFHARHNCAAAKDKLSAKFWACSHKW